MRRPWKGKPRKTLDCQKPSEGDLGLLLLHDPDDPTVDIVAVHGLCGHRSASWTAENGVNWLSDLLPSHLPRARLLTYGYDSTLYSSQHVAQRVLYWRAEKLITALGVLRQETQSEHRPVIFIGHSLGGVLIKSALILSREASSAKEDNVHAIDSSTVGLVFLGTPHRGSRAVPWSKLLEKIIAVNADQAGPILQIFKKDADWLETQLEQYKSLEGQIRSFYCYETKDSIVSCSPALVVPHVLTCPNECAARDASCIPMNADHRNLCRFPDDTDSNYKAVLNCLHAICQPSPMANSIPPDRERHSPTEHPRDRSCSDHGFKLPLRLPYCRNLNFVGREAELADIHGSLLGASHQPQSSSILLHGLGGTGKSEIALEFAYRYREDFSSVLWIDAHDTGSLQASYLGAAQALVDHYLTPSHSLDQQYLETARYLGLNTIVDRSGKIIPFHGSSTAIVEAVTEWLSRSGNRQWLVIFDAIDKLEEIRLSEVLPRTPWGSLIFTSRLENFEQAEGVIDIHPLYLRENIELFSKHSGIDFTPEDVDRIPGLYRRIGGSPTQVMLAAGCSRLVSSNADKSIKGFLKALEDGFSSAKNLPDQCSVLEWYCGKATSSSPALELLYQCSIFDYTNIPLEVLTEAYDPFDDRAPYLYETLSVFTSRSLMSRGRREDCISMLPPLHEQLRQLHSIDESVRRTRQGSMMIARSVERNKALHADAEKIWRVEQRVLPHVISCLLWAEPLYLKGEPCPDEQLKLAWVILSSVCERQGKSHEAQRFICLATQGIAAEVTRITSLLRLKSKCWGLEVQTWALYRALQDRIEDWPSADLERVMAALNSAASHQMQPSRIQAELVLKDLLRMTEEMEGPNSPSALRLMENLAHTYLNSKQSEKGEMWLKRLLLATEDQYSSDSPLTRSVLHKLVKSYESRGVYSRAEQLVRRKLRADEVRLGAEHPTCLRASGHLAILADQQGHFQDSTEQFLRTIEGFERVFGVNHQDTLNMCEELALSYRLRGQAPEAERHIRRSWEIRKLSHHKQSDLQRTAQILIDLLERQGKRGPAQALRKEAAEDYGIEIRN